jgi:lipopolysaccharide export system protein LptA
MMQHLRILACALALLAPAMAWPAQAEETGSKANAAQSTSLKDVNVEADQLEIFDDKKQAVFTGNVNGKRGDVTLNCDKLIVTYQETPQANNEKKTEVTYLDASGNVKIVTAKQTVTGQWAKMDVKANTVVVGGDVHVVQDKSTINGQKLFVDLNKNTSEMSGGRVKGSFVPARK